MQGCRSRPKSMKLHSMPSLWYSSCSRTNMGPIDPQDQPAEHPLVRGFGQSLDSKLRLLLGLGLLDVLMFPNCSTADITFNRPGRDRRVHGTSSFLFWDAHDLKGVHGLSEQLRVLLASTEASFRQVSSAMSSTLLNLEPASKPSFSEGTHTSFLVAQSAWARGALDPLRSPYRNWSASDMVHDDKTNPFDLHVRASVLILVIQRIHRIPDLRRLQSPALSRSRLQVNPRFSWASMALTQQRARPSASRLPVPMPMR
ncbi:hypothetical protein EYF80_006220 [Liparis tanakae]|uniref:Uncharacterized protein n=1 Tax=Liparis tanakae TaxID=230148 RepID=A0A4Z2J2I7_9TELE|nr:hypothetical protein EYF80_006220 [Liparis tanakae]